MTVEKDDFDMFLGVFKLHLNRTGPVQKPKCVFRVFSLRYDIKSFLFLIFFKLMINSKNRKMTEVRKCVKIYVDI